MFLAVDSSLGTQVALVDSQGVTRAEASSVDPRGHAEIIGVLLESVFTTAGVRPAEVTFVVMGIGPGPFTGLRVGMAAASAFALSRGVPLLPVLSHDALGYFADGDVVVVTDARRGEVAYSVYRREQENPRVLGPALVKLEDLDPVLAEARDLPRIMGAEIPAAELARVALDYQHRGVAFPEPTPRYLRAPDVSVPR